MLRAHPHLLTLTAAAFLANLAHDAAPSTFVLYSTWRYGWNERTVGLVLGLVGVASMIVQGGLVGRIVAALGERRALALGERRALAFGYLFGAAGNALFGFAPTGAWFLAAIPVTAFFGVASPAMQSMMTRRVGADEQGRLQGALGSMMGIASMTAPVLFTQVFAAAVGPYRHWNLPGAPFLIAGLLLVGAVAIALRVATPPAVRAAE